MTIEKSVKAVQVVALDMPPPLSWRRPSRVKLQIQPDILSS
jgi:hypothetical protein